MVALPQRQPMAMSPPRVRVAVVDDSVVVRGLLSRWLSETPAIEVAGTFRSGREIIEALPALQPRIILLDLDMPDMDGLTALPLILSKSPGTRVIVVSSLSVHGAEMTMRCLMKGATDYLPKPSNHREVSTSADFRQALIAKVLAVGGIRAAMRQQQAAPAPRPAPTPAPAATNSLFARTSSTGRVVAPLPTARLRSPPGSGAYRSRRRCSPPAREDAPEGDCDRRVHGWPAGAGEPSEPYAAGRKPRADRHRAAHAADLRRNLRDSPQAACRCRPAKLRRQAASSRFDLSRAGRLPHGHPPQG